MTCPQCEKAARSPRSGDYRASCLDCCARLVRSARPDQRMAAALLAAVVRLPGSPNRNDVLNHMRSEKKS